MPERQRKSEDKYKQRKTAIMNKQQEVITFLKNGKSKASVAKHLETGEASVYRILKNQNNYIN